MWTCSKCGSNVADQFTACQSCGTGVDGKAEVPPPTADSLNGATRPGEPFSPPELKAIEPPPPTTQQNMIRAAKAGALYGALYGAMYFFIRWFGFVMMAGSGFQFENGPIAALGEGLTVMAIVGAAIGVPIAVIFRTIFPYKPPESRFKS